MTKNILNYYQDVEAEITFDNKNSELTGTINSAVGAIGFNAKSVPSFKHEYELCADLVLQINKYCDDIPNRIAANESENSDDQVTIDIDKAESLLAVGSIVLAMLNDYPDKNILIKNKTS